MARPLKVGVQLPEVEREVGWDELIAMAKLAEEVGFDSIWLGDHLLYDLDVGPRGPWEVWTSLAAIAAVTERVEIGPLVAAAAFHAPAMLAKQAATVDGISNGRLVLGLGAGWNAREFSAFGFPFDNRVDRFAESFTIIRELIRTGQCSFSGQYNRIEDCVLHPRGPRPEGPPILIGSNGPRMLRLTIGVADAWNTWWSDIDNNTEGFDRLSKQVDEACEAVGRDPSEVARTCALLVQFDGGVGRRMGDYATGRPTPIRGTNSEVADRIAAFADVGASHVQLVLDPITESSIAKVGEVLQLLDA